jgi:hypothetical protein
VFQEEIHDIRMTFASSNMESCPIIEISTVHITSLRKQFLNTLDVPFAGEEKKHHGFVEVLRKRNH